MYIEQLYTNCLAEAAYYIESDGEAAIIDPIRETEPYVSLATSRGAKIKYVFETHFHADFVSGHIDLSKKTGADIVFGPSAAADYPIVVATDNQLFKLGKIQIQVLHTPGHTMESSCFLVIDEQGKPYAVFTGDTLFNGEVGRPDLAVSSSVTSRDLGHWLYHSIEEKLLTLPDETIVYPGHGAGSQCGKHIESGQSSTIGEQKKHNYALQFKSEARFVDAVTTGLATPPGYFHKNARINKTGYHPLHDILAKAATPMGPVLFENTLKETAALIVDSRDGNLFAAGFVPGSVNISLDGSFAIWAGTVLENLNQPILVVAHPGKEMETALRLTRVGFDNIIGYLEGGIDAWSASGRGISRIPCICPGKFLAYQGHEVVLDVRSTAEYDEGHLSNARNFPLELLSAELSGLDQSETYFIYCKSGYRSMIAASILRRNGFKHVVNIKKGYDGITSLNGSCNCSNEAEV